LLNAKENLTTLSKILIILSLIFFLPSIIFSYPTGWSQDYSLYKNGWSPKLFISDNVMGITFLSKLSNKTAVYMTLSYDNGKKWSEPKLLVEKIGKRFEYADGNADSNTLYIAWGEDDGYVYLLRYSFTNNQVISRDRIPSVEPFSCLPRIYIDDKTNIHLFFHKEDENKKVFSLYHIISFDKGNTWSKTHKIVEKINIQTRGIFFPSIIFWGDYIMAVWQNRQGGIGDEKLDDELYFSFSKDLGQTWAYPHRLTNNKFDDARPFMILGPDYYTIYLFWESNKTGDWDIYMLKGNILDNDTIEWQPEDTAEVVSETSADSRFAVPLIKDNLLYIFWYDFRENKSQIYYRYYNLDRKTFSEEIRLTDTTRDSKRPSVTLTSNIINVAWEERIENYSEVYFKTEDKEVSEPIIISPTHSSNKWSKNNNVKFETKTIKDESGIKGYSYIFDEYPSTVPDIVNYGSENFEIEFQDVPDGIHYLHIRAIDNNNNWSKTSHYKIMIDTSGPEISDLQVEPYKDELGKYNIKLSWEANDYNKILGYSYNLSTKILKDLKNEVIIKTNYVMIHNVKSGAWFFHIIGEDSLGNWGTTKFFRFILTADDIPPTPPQISSSTVEQSQITTDNSPDFKIVSVDNTGIKGYNYEVTTNSNHILKNKLQTTKSNISIKNLNDGKWYLFAKSVDYNDNWSEQSSFSFSVDSTPPQIKMITAVLITNVEFITNKSLSTNTQITNEKTVTNTITNISLSTNTNISVTFNWELYQDEDNVTYSYSFSERKIDEPQLKDMTVFTKAEFDHLKKINYYFNVRAKDRYGNWSKPKLFKLILKKKIKKKPIQKISGADLFIYDDILYYRIQSGDKLADIIKRVIKTDKPQLFINSIAKYNKIKNIDIIYVGGVIKFPLLKIKETIVIEKIKPYFLEFIKEKIFLVYYSKDGVKVKKIKNIGWLKKGFYVMVHLPIFFETGKFFFY